MRASTFHSLLLLYDWDCQTILLPFWSVSASTQFLLYSERDVEKRPTYPPPYIPSQTQFYLLTPGHGVGKQQPYPCLQRPRRLLLASYPLPFSRKAGFVLQRWVSVNVVCSLVTVLKPLMTLTRSSSSTYCKEGEKRSMSAKAVPDWRWFLHFSFLLPTKNCS